MIKAILRLVGKTRLRSLRNTEHRLYVYDVALIRQRARAFKQTFEKFGVKSQVAYASKAFSSIAMLQLIQEEGLSLDVVSGGELYTALNAEFPVEKIHFHGNNKSEVRISNGFGTSSRLYRR